jgi:hypothetical protein
MHIGRKIEEVFRIRKMGATQFARLLNTSRSNVYSIFRRPSLDTAQLSVICEVLEFNFFAELAQDMLGRKGFADPMSSLEDPATEYLKQKEDLESKLLSRDEEVRVLQSRLRDKDEIIALLKQNPGR